MNNYSQTIILLKELFGINNEQLKTAKKERIDKQYYVEFKAREKEVKEGINIAEEFNSIIKEKVDTISLEQINKIKIEFKKYF